MTIRLRLALIFSIATLVLLIGGGVLFVTQLESGLEAGLTATAESRADAIISQIGPNPSAFLAAAGNRRQLFGVRNGTYIQLLDMHGHVIGTPRALQRTPLLTPARTRIASIGTLVFDSSVDVAVGADSGPEPMRVLAKRIGRSDAVVAVALSRDVVDKAVSRARRELVLLDIAVLLLAGPGSWLLTRAALRPVERMRLEVNDLDARNVHAGVNVPNSHDEIAKLGQTFNGLLGRLHAALSREQALVADAGHELRTPLTVLKGELELASRPGRTREELTRTVAVAAEETDRLVRLTEDLLFLSVEDSDTRGLGGRTFDVTAVVRAAVQAVAGRDAVREDGLEFRIDGPDEALAAGNPDWIRQAVDNLLVNAAHYAGPGTTVTVSVRQDAFRTQVIVADDGVGFPPDFLPIAFNRFTRADGSRARSASTGRALSGNGLGLAIVRSVLARHGGSATAANRPEGGAAIVLSWPTRRQTG